MDDENLFCAHCGSRKIIKKGKYVSEKKTWWRHRYKCKQCGFTFNEQTKHLMDDYSPPPFKYKEKPVRKTNWASFNAAQINEKEMFVQLVNELLDMVAVEQKQVTGRPSNKIRDMVFCMLLKTFTKLSSRRLISDLRQAKEMGYISKAPCYSTIMVYFNDARLKRLLTELIELSAMPLAKVERGAFSLDSSGFSTSQFGRWFSHKWGKESERRIYQKAHLICGTRSNVVTAAMITNCSGADCHQLEYLTKRTALNFNVKEILGDMAYSSRKNLELVHSMDATPYIPFRKTTRENGAKNGPIWKKMYLYFKNNPQEFYRHYHMRSNSETVFFQIKQRFGSSLMTKNETANVNEILCKVLAHNLCCLIAAYYEFNVETSFCTQTQKVPIIQFK